MSDIAYKLLPVAKKIIAEKGGLDLFALFAPQDTPESLDLVVSAPWAVTQPASSMEFIIDKLKAALPAAEMRKLSSVTIMGMTAILSATLGTKDQADSVETYGPFVLNGVPIQRAQVIVLKQPKARKRRRTIS
jgi:hypothetical protein